jgi:hypothetical protein
LLHDEQSIMTGARTALRLECNGQHQDQHKNTVQQRATVPRIAAIHTCSMIAGAFIWITQYQALLQATSVRKAKLACTMLVNTITLSAAGCCSRSVWRAAHHHAWWRAAHEAWRAHRGHGPCSSSSSRSSSRTQRQMQCLLAPDTCDMPDVHRG